MILKVIAIALLTEQVVAQLICPQIKFSSKSSLNWWSGNFEFISPIDATGVQLQITFSPPIRGLATLFGQFYTRDNTVYTITNQSVCLERGETLSFPLIAITPRDSWAIPHVTAITLNGIQICPSTKSINVTQTLERNCVDFEMNGDEFGGRWNASLTIYPQRSNSKIKVDVELDEPALAFDNDLGPATTSDRKRYNITSRDLVSSWKPLKLRFFVQYNELKAIPRLTAVYIDGVSICVIGLLVVDPVFTSISPIIVDLVSTTQTNEIVDNKLIPDFNEEYWIQDLPLSRFSQISHIPDNVENDEYECGSSSNVPRRYKGRKVTEPGQFPFHVAIYRVSKYVCGGTLISPKAVVTAAHCVVNDKLQLLNKENFELLFGAVDLKTLSGNEALRDVEEIIKHPNFENNPIPKEDIALLIIKGNLQFSDTINHICLPASYTPIMNHLDTRFFILGFGSATNSRKRSRHLLYGLMSIISRDNCISSYREFFHLSEDSAFCAKSADNMAVCPGFCGDGLLSMVNGRLHLRGLASVSTMNDICDPKRAVAFTDVSYFLDWIDNTLATR